MTKHTKELILAQLDAIPEDYLKELLDFIAFLRSDIAREVPVVPG